MTKRHPITPGVGSEPSRTASEHAAVTEHSGLSEFDLAALPTEMRRQLLGGELPVVPAHELFDTSPPNRKLTAPTLRDSPSARSAIGIEAVEEPPSIPLQSKRIPLIVLLLVAVVLVVIAVLLFQFSGSPSAAIRPAPTAAATTVGAAPIPRPVSQPAPAKKIAAANSAPEPQRLPAEPTAKQPLRASTSQQTTPPKAPQAKPREPRTAAPSASSREQSGSLLHSIVAPENE